MKSKFTNIRLILEKLRRNPMLRKLPLETIVDYTEDFMRIVGCPCEFLEKTCVVEIDKYKGVLPDDFHEVIQVREASDSLAAEDYIRNNLTRDIIYSVRNRYDDDYGEFAVQIEFDLSEANIKKLYSLKDIDFGGYGAICVDMSVNNSSSDNTDMTGFTFRSGYRPMRSSTDSFHMNGQPKNCRELTYKIENHRIFTSEESGYVEVAYRALAIDEDGLPLIPDNSKFTRALEWYIKQEYYTILFESGEIDARVLQNTQQEYCWAVGAYESECHMLTIDEMQSLTNSLNQLVVRINEHDKSFIHEGTREYIRRK